MMEDDTRRRNDVGKGNEDDGSLLDGGRKESINLYGWLVSLTAGLGGFLFGYEVGIINQILTMLPFQLFFNMVEMDPTSGHYINSADRADTEGWITFTFLIGAAAGALFVSYLMNAIGRKRTIILGGSVFLVSVVLQTIATSPSLLYLGRVGAGIAVGLESATVPVYISETAPTAIRGRLIGLYELMINIGIFVATCVNSLIILWVGDQGGNFEWRLSLGLQVIPCVLMMSAMSVMPYSPRYLIYRGDKQQGLKSLAKLRSREISDEFLQREYEEILTSIDEQKRLGEASWKSLFIDRKIRFRTFLGITNQFFQQWTGINVILYFGSTLFDAMGFSPMLANIGFPIINSLIKVFATLPGMYLIEKMGRRKLMIVGGIGMSISLLMVTLFGQIGQSRNTLDTLGTGAITFVLSFTLFFGSTWGPVVWVYQAEVFPLRYRAKAVSASTISNWVWNAIVSKIAPIMMSRHGFMSYLLWAGFCFVMSLYAYFFVAETKGLSLEQPHNRDIVTPRGSEAASEGALISEEDTSEQIHEDDFEYGLTEEEHVQHEDDLELSDDDEVEYPFEGNAPEEETEATDEDLPTFAFGEDDIIDSAEEDAPEDSIRKVPYWEVKEERQHHENTESPAIDVPNDKPVTPRVNSNLGSHGTMSSKNDAIILDKTNNGDYSLVINQPQETDERVVRLSSLKASSISENKLKDVQLQLQHLPPIDDSATDSQLASYRSNSSMSSRFDFQFPPMETETEKDWSWDTHAELMAESFVNVCIRSALREIEDVTMRERLSSSPHRHSDPDESPTRIRKLASFHGRPSDVDNNRLIRRLSWKGILPPDQTARRRLSLGNASDEEVIREKSADASNAKGAMGGWRRRVGGDELNGEAEEPNSEDNDESASSVSTPNCGGDVLEDFLEIDWEATGAVYDDEDEEEPSEDVIGTILDDLPEVDIGEIEDEVEQMLQCQQENQERRKKADQLMALMQAALAVSVNRNPPSQQVMVFPGGSGKVCTKQCSLRKHDQACGLFKKKYF
ncbi:hypothetical protein PROFUN_09779 [Planoprotostelium fungivorum]|uniref:Major facilitator superfamily (MFS) profile domain-containing protein n=1 Tax=Planoprotostelium fungivorum TaxID=1890364 RepID=A0A2P6NGM6_9EUKA|nr:hypothetical protein PROFUN_09779 [Planoprotostelium fungivorum]